MITNYSHFYHRIIFITVIYQGGSYAMAVSKKKFASACRLSWLGLAVARNAITLPNHHAGALLLD